MSVNLQEFFGFFSNFLNFWRRPFWKWRPSWKIWNMITLLHIEVHFCGKFGFDRLSGLPVRLRTKWPPFVSFGRHLQKKRKSEKNFVFRFMIRAPELPRKPVFKTIRQTLFFGGHFERPPFWNRRPFSKFLQRGFSTRWLPICR